MSSHIGLDFEVVCIHQIRHSFIHPHLRLPFTRVVAVAQGREKLSSWRSPRGAWSDHVESHSPLYPLSTYHLLSP
jgi:hypothetical protein